MLDEADLRLSAYNAEQAAVAAGAGVDGRDLVVGGPSARDWAQLFGDNDEAGELARINDEALALREAVRRRLRRHPDGTRGGQVEPPGMAAFPARRQDAGILGAALEARSQALRVKNDA